MWQPIYEELFRTQEWGKYPPEHVVRFVARNFYKVPDRSRVHLLDLGCGPGANTWFMAREGFSVSAIDGSPTGIARCRERLSKEGLKADLRVGEFLTLPWPDGVFDAVIDSEALTCNPPADWEKALDEVRRVLKPEGLLLSACFSKATTEIRDRGYVHYLHQDEVEQMYRGFASLSIDEQSRTSSGALFHEFVITARR